MTAFQFLSKMRLESLNVSSSWRNLRSPESRTFARHIENMVRDHLSIRNGSLWQSFLCAAIDWLTYAFFFFWTLKLAEGLKSGVLTEGDTRAVKVDDFDPEHQEVFLTITMNRPHFANHVNRDLVSAIEANNGFVLGHRVDYNSVKTAGEWSTLTHSEICYSHWY